MVRQYTLKAHTSLGSKTFIHVSEELAGTVHVTTKEGSLYLDKAEVLDALNKLTEEVEHGN